MCSGFTVKQPMKTCEFWRSPTPDYKSPNLHNLVCFTGRQKCSGPWKAHRTMAANIYLPQEGSEALPAYYKGLKLSVRNESESDASSLRWTTTCQAQTTETISGFHSQCHATFLHLTCKFCLECTLFWEWNCVTFSRKITTLTTGLSPAVCCDRQP